MATISLYPLQLSPAAIGRNYTSEPIIPVGGNGTYTFSISTGSPPPGVNLNTTTASGQAILAGRPLVADQYSINTKYAADIPSIVNPSTFTLTVNDTGGNSGSQTYTIPVLRFTEDESISIYEMLAAVYQVTPGNNQTTYYIAMGEMGTRVLKIGDVGDPAFGGINLNINAYLSGMSEGTVNRMRYYIRRWDQVKLITIKQMAGGVSDITGVNMSWDDKRRQILSLVKSSLPAWTMAEIEARTARKGGNDSVGSVTGQQGGGGGSVSLSMR